MLAAATVGILGSALRTNDDAHMFASVSGFTGGTARPELLFTNVGIGLLLTRLYAVAPDLPWYGLLLQVLLGLALVVLVASVVRLVGGRSGRAGVLAAGAVTAASVVVEVSSLQFTVVAILLAAAGIIAFPALRLAGVRPMVAASLGGGIATLGSLVRLQGFVLGAVLAGAALLILSAVRRTVGLRELPALALALTLGVGAGLTLEAAWWANEAGSPRSIGILESGLARDGRASGGRSPGLSENDRRLISDDWFRFPAEQFAYPTDSARSVATNPTSGRNTSGSDGQAGSPSPIRSARLRGFLGDQGAWLALAALIALAAPTRRGRAAALLLVGAGTGLLLAVSGTRLPDRVGGPAWLTIVLLALALGHAADRVEHSEAHRLLGGRTSRTAGIVALALAVAQAATMLGTAAARSDDRDLRVARAEEFIEVADRTGGPGATFVLWLVDPWVVVDPLITGGTDAYRIRTVEVGGWVSTLPYYRDMRADLDMQDWIGAVVERDDVLLIAAPERIERFQILLRERRGLLCTEPEVVGTVNGGADVVVRRFESVTCAGARIDP